MRNPGRVGSVLLALGVGACDGPSSTRGSDGSPSDFCVRAQAAVDSFTATLPPQSDLGPRFGGTVVVGGLGELRDGMNAFVSADYAASQHQSFVNLMTLLQYDSSLSPKPYLAESWEVSEDVTELTFHLRDDVLWHDGTPTTAHDVAFTYRRVTDPATGFPNAAFWDRYDSSAEGVAVLDSFTVRMRLEPHSDYLDPWRFLPILPRHLLEGVPPAELKQHPFGARCPVGNGPFRFVEHRLNQSWTFAANPVFPAGLGGRPYVDRYVFRVIPEQATLLTELLTEGIDVYVAPPPDQAEELLDSDVVDLSSFVFRNFVFVGWNARRPQLADRRVRRAITQGTNRAELIEALRAGFGRVANSSVPPFHWGYNGALADSLPYDPAAAERLLDEAGWVDRDGDGVRESAEGLALEISVKYNEGSQERRDIAEIMQSQLARIGVSVQPQMVEWATLIDQLNDADARDFDGVVMSWVTEFRIDDSDLFHSSRIDGSYAWAGTANPELDEIMEQLPGVLDRESAIPLWHRYQALLMQEQPYTFFFFPLRLQAVNRRLQDVVMDVRGDWVNIREWWIPEDQRVYGSDGS